MARLFTRAAHVCGTSTISTWAPALRSSCLTRPPALLRDYLQAFIRLDFQRGHIDNTAGGGKSNSIVYAVSLIRAMDESVLVCMLGKEAKQEMLRRGLMAFEVNNYHSITDRAYKVSTISIAEANAYNAPQRARSCSRRRCL